MSKSLLCIWTIVADLTSDKTGHGVFVNVTNVPPLQVY